jgi:WD40 repeat protein
LGCYQWKRNQVCFSLLFFIFSFFLNQKISRTFNGHTENITTLEISPDGTKLISSSLDSTVRVWDINSGTELASYPYSSRIFSLAVCPGESWVAAG